ncbi:MAG: LysR family transcriptional regulator [Candidatus Bathyarchaeota archaeon]|nr:LysR family transcriptional regulator [Candidatus Termiticorpusculum sp.]
MDVLGYRAKLWMVNSKGEPVFGDGITELVEAIDKCHSIVEAARCLNMSYRYALHRITLAEKRLGELLVVRVRGGAKGGGSSEVTLYGKNLVLQYRRAQMELRGVLEKMP